MGDILFQMETVSFDRMLFKVVAMLFYVWWPILTSYDGHADMAWKCPIFPIFCPTFSISFLHLFAQRPPTASDSKSAVTIGLLKRYPIHTIMIMLKRQCDDQQSLNYFTARRLSGKNPTCRILTPSRWSWSRWPPPKIWKWTFLTCTSCFFVPVYSFVIFPNTFFCEMIFGWIIRSSVLFVETRSTFAVPLISSSVIG